MEPRMPLEPGFYPRMFVRAVIIHDQMEVESRRSFGVDFLEKTDELLVSMARCIFRSIRPLIPDQSGHRSERSDAGGSLYFFVAGMSQG